MTAIVVTKLRHSSYQSHFIDIRNDADRASYRNLVPAAFSPLAAPCAPKLSCPQVLRCASAVGAFPLAQAQRGPVDAALFSIRFFHRDETQST